MTYNPKLIREEKDLFNFIKNNFIPDLIPTELRKRYDCFSEFYQMDIELKCRRKHYSKLLIEKPKYNALMNRCKAYCTTPVYINSTPKGVWAFYIQDHDIVWEKKSLPINTDFGNNSKIIKEVGYLDIKNGIDLLLLFSGENHL
jgi:hypothetical protein|tara:strand:- start:34766 stop:35197 length:432 start_codon:yes stop_codon:yes gene_type:complete